MEVDHKTIELEYELHCDIGALNRRVTELRDLGHEVTLRIVPGDRLAFDIRYNKNKNKDDRDSTAIPAAS